MLVLPNGKTWQGTLGNLLRALNCIWAEKLKALVAQVEQLEKHADPAAMQKAVDAVAIQMTAN